MCASYDLPVSSENFMKTTQKIMIWLLPVILIGGFFWPVLGYLVVGMIAFFLVLSLFMQRFWCWYLCPRGAFLELVMSYFSFRKNTPRIFMSLIFRWSVLALLMTFLIYRITMTGGDLLLIGAVFVSMCTLTTIIAIIFGITFKPRSWCVICPMGTMQETIGKAGKKIGTSRR
jgi:ferredoxin-type protein NapH